MSLAPFWQLAGEIAQQSVAISMLPPSAKRLLYKAMVLAASAHKEEDKRQQFVSLVVPPSILPFQNH